MLVTTTEQEPGPGAAGEVEAGPTKQFFVSMITRDIALQPAIVDLVDNSVDGARRVRGQERLDGLTVALNFDGTHFRIKDNCGGIPLDTARLYAFKFGRPDGAPGVDHSVGQFGIGMKRALFKLGTAFSVDSTAAESYFSLRVNVLDWQRDNENWNFPLAAANEAVQDEAAIGTTLVVDVLHPEVAEDLSLDTFTTSLVADLRAKHRLSLDRGLTITVNGAPVEPWPVTLLVGPQLSPGRRTKTYAAGWPAPVITQIVVGVADSAPAEAGWYVFCNNRLVVGPDQTNLTGWGEGRGRTIPRFHTQFARFRGYVFFDSDRAALLPMTTTKVGVDTTSAVWRSTRPQMIQMARPVIDFLNAIDWENPQTLDDDTGQIESALTSSTLEQVDILPTTDADFLAPKRGAITPPPATSSIQYRRLVSDIDQAKELLGVSTNTEVGNLTFEYFLDAEG